MALKVSRKEFLGVDELGIPDPDVIAAKMALDFETAVYLEMKRRGLRQKDLARAMGVTPATVSKTLSETSNMTFKTAARIANALGCTVDAPVLHAFDAIEYDSMYTVTETASTDVPIPLCESGYKGMGCLEKMKNSDAQSTTQQIKAPVFGVSCGEGLVA